jgi:hypothetical protein
MTPRGPLALSALLCCALGCVAPLSNLPVQRRLSLQGTELTVRWAKPSTDELQHLETLLEQASQVVKQRGQMASPVTLSVVDSHEALEEVTGRKGYSWLRAWSYPTSIVLQAPSTWGPRGASDAQLLELLTHELTHCWMFQAMAPAPTTSVPLWFREGLATVTARQGLRHQTLEELANWLEAHPQHNLFHDGEALAQSQFDSVYSFAHHSVAFFIRRHGDEAVASLLHQLSLGASFSPAFQHATQWPLADFEKRFEAYLHQRAFRGLDE